MLTPNKYFYCILSVLSLFALFPSYEEVDVTTKPTLKQQIEQPEARPRPSFSYEPTQRLLERVSQPYLGVHDQKLWDQNGFFGRIMSPVEDIYMHFLPDSDMVKSININQQRVIT